MSSGLTDRDLPELAVVGWPLEKTFSPPMQARALAESNLSWRYEAIPVKPDDLVAFLESARNPGSPLKGLNVTVPHKEAVRGMCTELHGLSGVSGAVNTVVFRRSGTGGTEAHGYNTDAPGLIRALKARAGIEPKGLSAVVFGAGGAAAGCVAALAEAGAREVTVANRTLGRARALCSRLAAAFPRVRLTAVPLAAAPAPKVPVPVPSQEAASETPGIIVNCVPQQHTGIFRPFLDSIGPGCAFVDLSYGEGPTELHRLAALRKARVVPGQEVLLWQGALSFELFTGSPAPVSAMRDELTKISGRWWLEC